VEEGENNGHDYGGLMSSPLTERPLHLHDGHTPAVHTQMTTQDPRVEVLFSSEAIAKRIDGLAESIRQSGLNSVLVVPILKGSFIFAADLIRAMHRVGLAPEVDFLSLASYGEAEHSSGTVRIVRDVESDVRGRDVLIVDDILESGRTLAFAKGLLQHRGATRVETCVLLDKKVPRAVPFMADFAAFECPNEFVVGYGMDLAHRYRELPFVGRLVRAEGPTGGHDGTNPSR
jgi:hypoxanthine phosphoribosyltransferase